MTGSLLVTLLGHWWARPGLLVALLSGLVAATALWSGVQALNGEARASYDRAAAVLGGDRLERITHPSGRIGTEAYVALRRTGWQVSPVLEGRARVGDVTVRVLGIDILTLPPGGPGTAELADQGIARSFLAPPWLSLAHPETADGLEVEMPVRTDPDVPPGMLVMDIAAAQRMTGAPGGISYLLLASAPAGADLAAVDPMLMRTAPEAAADLAQLTASFHFNLTIFGLMSFVLGLFIVQAAVGLAFEQRRGMIRTMRACGASARSVAVALILELVLLVIVAWALGMGLGYVMAAALLPDMAASLRGLYGAPLDGELSLSPAWWLAGLAMTALGAGLAAARAVWRLVRLDVLALAQTEAWRSTHLRNPGLQAGAGMAALVLAAGLALAGGGLLTAFASVAALLGGAALLLPVVLSTVLGRAAVRVGDPLRHWFLAETRAQVPALSLALSALLLALAVNIGVGTMVSSFRQTFLDYLDQRLAADLYLRAETEAQADAVLGLLAGDGAVREVFPIRSTEIEVSGYPVSLYGISEAGIYRESWPILEGGGDPWAEVFAGTGILVSEQMARRLELEPGDVVEVPAPGEVWELTVTGVYPDYGNATGQALVALEPFDAHWPGAERTRYGIVTAPGAAAEVAGRVSAAVALPGDGLVDQAGLKAFSRGIFERTFAVTLALNSLTFLVAGMALLTSLLTLAEMRLAQVAPVWALGVTRRRLAGYELGRSVLLAALTAALAVPLGLALAWLLLERVNVAAFGWRIPVQMFPGQWAAVAALALAVALIAAAWPSRRLLRLSPAALLRVFADAR